MKAHTRIHTKPSSLKAWEIGLSLFFGTAVWLFWKMVYPAHLHYHEQYQLFLFDMEYFKERIAIPGGVADYIGEFLVQFYYHTWMGATILALLFIGLQLLTWTLAKRLKASEAYYPLSFLPAIAVWHFMCDENAMLSFTVALLMTLGFNYLYTLLHTGWKRAAYVLIGLPILLWMAGAAHLVFMGWVIINELHTCIKQKKYLRGIGITIGMFILKAGCTLLISMQVQNPVYQLSGFLGYYRFPAVIPHMEMTIILLFLLLPYLLARLPQIHQPAAICMGLQTIALAVISYPYILSGCNLDKEEIMEYDQLARNRQWHRIIQKAEAKSPVSPLSVACLNLALGKTGQLGRMFEFYQNGTEGLMAKFQRNFVTPLPTSEVLYHLGMINDAQRFTFEAMEAIPNFRKSGRCFKRLSETNLINGQYEVAAKYLRLLSKTLFYKEWAEETMTYLYDEDKINAHSEWGQLRQMRYTENFLSENHEAGFLLARLYEQNRKNRMAFEYLLACTLQQRDLQGFMKYYSPDAVADRSPIPRSHQEALVYVWGQTHKDFRDIPYELSPQVIQDAKKFMQIYTSQPNRRQLLQTRYKGTFWYYLLVRK